MGGRQGRERDFDPKGQEAYKEVIACFATELHVTEREGHIVN